MVQSWASTALPQEMMGTHHTPPWTKMAAYNIGPNGHGTIVHIGLIENNQCEDSNGSPGIQTSTGLGETSHLGLIRLEIEAYQLHKRVHCLPHRGQ